MVRKLLVIFIAINLAVTTNASGLLSRFFKCICCRSCTEKNDEDLSPRFHRIIDDFDGDSMRGVFPHSPYGSVDEELTNPRYLSLRTMITTTTTTTTTPPSTTEREAMYVSPVSQVSEGIFDRVSILLQDRDYASSRFHPQIAGDREKTQMTKFGTVVLGSLIATTGSSTVFNLESHPGYIIKYTTDCLDRGTVSDSSLHPLARDYLFLSLLDITDDDSAVREDEFDQYIEAMRSSRRNNPENIVLKKVAPKPIYISPPVYHTGGSRARSSKVKFGLSRSVNWEYCVAVRAEIRYMIMEKVVGMTWNTFQLRSKHGVMHPSQAIGVGSQVVRIIQYMQNMGIFHNDIHASNVVLRSPDNRVMLIDFGRAKFVDNYPSTGVAKTDEFGTAWASATNSPWEIAGYEQSIRDDLYKVMESMAMSIFGDDLLLRMKEAQKVNLIRLYNWKTRANIFQIFPGQLVDNVPDFTPAYAELSTHLGGLLNLVRRIASNDSVELNEVMNQLLTGFNRLYNFAKSNKM